jgi:DNA-binding transcriptional MerR regulator
VKRRGNRRYYQHHEVLLIRRIRELLYEEGFTISGARNRLDSSGQGEEKPEPVRNNGRAAGGNHDGADLTAIKRELRAVLDQLQG